MDHQVEIDKLATGPRKTLLKCRQITNIVTFNATTLKKEMKAFELTHLAEKYELDVMCTQEHTIQHDDINIKYQNMAKGWMLVTSSATKTQYNATMLLSTK